MFKSCTNSYFLLFMPKGTNLFWGFVYPLRIKELSYEKIWFIPTHCSKSSTHHIHVPWTSDLSVMYFSLYFEFDWGSRLKTEQPYLPPSPSCFHLLFLVFLGWKQAWIKNKFDTDTSQWHILAQKPKFQAQSIELLNSICFW